MNQIKAEKWAKLNGGHIIDFIDIFQYITMKHEMRWTHLLPITDPYTTTPKVHANFRLWIRKS